MIGRTINRSIPEVYMADESQQVLRAEREVGGKLFGLLWAATALQMGLIIWELLNLMPLTAAWLGDLAGPAIHATEFTTSAYLIFQMAYMGRKEFSRWTKGVSGWINLGTAGKLPEEETVRRVRRSDVAVALWGGLLLLCVCLHALTAIPKIPQELFRTAIQVVGLYALALVSKAKKESVEKETAR